MALNAQHVKNTLLRSSGLVIFFLLWEFAPRLGWVDTQFVPPFSTVFHTIHHLWLDGSLITHLVVSLWRALLGLLIAVIIALPLGFLLGGWLTGLAQTLNPLFRLLGQVNPFSLMPVFILFFGIGEGAKLAIVAWVCLWPVLFHTITGVQTIDPLLLKSALAMGISRPDLFTKVLLPGAAPTIFVGLRLGAGLAFFMLIAAEMLGASAGLGWLLHNAGAVFQIPRIYAAGFFIILMRIVVNRVLLYLEKGIFIWKESSPVFMAGTDTGKVSKLTRRELALATVILVGILFYGGIEVEKVNQGLNQDNHSNHQSHQEK